MLTGELNFNELIDKANEIVADPQIGFAAAIEKPVSVYVDEKGYKWYLSLRLEHESVMEERNANMKEYKGND